MKEKRKSLILLLLLAIGSLSTAYADITKTDNSALWALIVKTYPTLVANKTTLTSAELATITELNSKGVSDKASVTNLDGIDQLTSLTRLVLSGYTSLTTMPAFPTSLTNLIWTECAVSSLDLSSYTNLQELNMQGSAANTTVTTITLPASDSQLKILNVFNHKSLATINNLGACGNLEEMDLGLTQYPGNGSDGTLDLSVFPDIKILSIDRDAKIKKLIITDQEMSDLTYLKLDGHPELTKEADFKEHLKKCTNLETLSLRNCGFTDNTLDVTGHTALKKLYVSNCGLVTLNLSDVHVQLEVLDCASNSLPELYIPSSVTTLTISANSFDSVDDLKNFSSATNLKKLTCNSNSDMAGTFDFTNYQQLQQIEFKDCSKITKISGLSSSKNTLTILRCSNCNLEANSLDVSELSNLTLLNCTGNSQLTSINVTNCTSLQTLGCGNCNISVLDISGMENLKSLYCPNNKIEELKLNTNSLTFINCENNALTSLDLSKDAGKLINRHDEGWQSSTTGQKISKAVGVIEGNRLYVKIPSPSLTWNNVSVEEGNFKVNGTEYPSSEVQAITGEEGYSYLVFTDPITASTPYFTLNDDGTSSDINIIYTYHPCGSATVNDGLTDTELYKNRTNTVNMSVTISINAFAQKISPYATDSENEGKYFSTLYLPDNRSKVANMELSDCKFYTVTGATDIDNNHTKRLTLEEQSLDVIPTKTPLLVVAPASKMIVYNKVTDEAAALTGTNFLKGSFSTDFSGTIYTLGRNKSTNYHGLIGFWRYTGDSLVPYICYIESFGTASAKGFLLSFKDEPTGINNIENAGNVDESNETWYTVDGVRLNGKPKAKGIYIKNNKKVIIAE